MPRTKASKSSRTRRSAGAGKSAPLPDRHILYEKAVQCVESEIDFVDETFKSLRRRRARRLREDFCGTAASACEWVRRRPSNEAVGLDLDQPTLDWGMEHNVAKLKPSARKRVTLLNRNVVSPGRGTGNMDCVLAMNFSYWILTKRPEMRKYFRKVRDSLVKDGIFFLDFYGGWETTRPQVERRQIGGAKTGFTYIWDQAEFDPITSRAVNYIHFRLADGRYMRRAFSYEWRVWTIPEILELLEEAGFSKSTVYWEGEDDDGEGSGIFTPHDQCEDYEQCPAYIAYIVAER